MKLKAISTVSALSLAIVFSACGGAATNTNVANKAANATNAVANTAGNMTNAVANAVSPNTTSNSNAAASTTGGDMITIDAAGIQVAAPKGFKVQKDGETTNLISADDAFEVYFHVPKDGNYDKALDEATTEIDDYIKDVKVVSKGEKGNFGGMDATMFDGTGVDKEDGKPVSWELIVLDAPKKPVLIVSYGDKETNTKYSKEITEIANSIKKQ
jgi:hypothetical protein